MPKYLYDTFHRLIYRVGGCVVVVIVVANLGKFRRRCGVGLLGHVHRLLGHVHRLLRHVHRLWLHVHRLGAEDLVVVRSGGRAISGLFVQPAGEERKVNEIELSHKENIDTGNIRG